MQKYIAYYRVSTKKQDYGIDAQKHAVHQYLKSRGGELSAEFEEKESGKNDERPQLKNAIEMSKQTGSSLIISKLDRLSREVSFLFDLKAELDRAGVHIVCCDLPDLNTLTLGIFATMAQHERELISTRTKEGLKVAREKGKQIGTPDPVPEYVRLKGIKARQDASKKYYHSVRVVIDELRQKNSTYAYIANFLNNAGFKTRHGKKFWPATIQQLAGVKQKQYNKTVLYQIINMRRNKVKLAEIARELNAQGLTTARNRPFTADTVRYVIKKVDAGDYR